MAEPVAELSNTQKAMAILLETGSIPGSSEEIATAYANRAVPKEVVPTEDSVNADIQESEAAVPADESVEESTEESIAVADGKSVKIDWSDRKGITKAIQLAADRNAQKAAKDTALNQVIAMRTQLAEAEKNNADLAAILTKIQESKKEGPNATLKHLFGKDIETLQAEAEERAAWSPEVKENYELRQKLADAEALIAGAKDTSKEVLAQIQKDKDDVIQKSVQNHFEVSYRKHTFEGKLGNAELEEDLDENLFNNVRAKFNSKEASTITIVDIEAAFKAERTRLVKLYGSQTETRTAAELERKKKDALVAAQGKAGRGEGKTTAQQRFEALRAARKYSEIAADPVLRAFL